jgi:hypothetical protein
MLWVGGYKRRNTGPKELFFEARRNQNLARMGVRRRMRICLSG